MSRAEDWNRRETIDWDRLVAIKKREDYLDMKKPASTTKITGISGNPLDVRSLGTFDTFGFTSHGDAPPLAQFGRVGDWRKCLQRARQYAKENPKARGYVVADNNRTMGCRFYLVRNGEATTVAAVECLPNQFFAIGMIGKKEYNKLKRALRRALS